MKRRMPLIVAVVLASVSNAALAETAKTIVAPSGEARIFAPCVQQVDTTCVPVSAANPLPVTGGSGGGGGSATGPAAAASSQSVTPQILTTVKSTAYTSSLVVKTGAGRLYGLTALATVTGYILPFDATTCPADGAATPLIPTLAYVTANAPIGVSFGDQPLTFTTGLVLCFSSTGPFTKTASSTAAFSAQVQ